MNRHLTIEELAANDELWEAIAGRKSPEELGNILRQLRSPEEIRRDNAEAQADYDRARDQQEWTR